MRAPCQGRVLTSLVTLHNLIHLTRSLLLALQVSLTDKLISSPQQESEVREVDTSRRNSGPVIRWTTCLFTAENQFQLRISSKSGVCGELLRAKKAAHCIDFPWRNSRLDSGLSESGSGS